MRRLLLVAVAAAAVSALAAAPAHADCVEVDGNGSVIYTGPLGTVYGVDVDTNPSHCLRTASDVLNLPPINGG